MSRMSINEALAVGDGHFRAGRLVEAIAVGQAIRAAFPQESGAYRLLGVVAYAAGDQEKAAAFLGQAIALAPQVASYHANLSNVLVAQRRFAEAEAAARRALALQPGMAEAENDLGIALHGQGRLAEAEAAYRRAVAANAENACALSNLGAVLRDQQRYQESEAALQRAVAIHPRFADAQINLGTTLQSLARLDEAAAAFRRALAADPRQYRALCNLGGIFQLQDRLADAEACYRQALEINPNDADSYANLSVTLWMEGRLGEATAAFRRAIAIQPNHVNAHINFGLVLQSQGLLAEARAEFFRALELDPAAASAHSNALFCEQYFPDATPASLTASHAEWQRRHAAPLQRHWLPHDNLRDPQRRLRLGFVSGDLCRHPVSNFLVRAFEALDLRQCELHCYSTTLKSDLVSDRLRAVAAGWHDVRGLMDDALARQIRDDRIDILFDLAGHTATNRLLCFARKPAPIQITWIGYEGTTGLAAMDYLLADGFQVPPGEETNYREQVLRLPAGYVCYDPPFDAPPVGPLPAASAGCITFGSFNNPSKITPEVVPLWAEILRRLPEARLLLKYNGLADAPTVERFERLFAEQGIPAERLEFQGWELYPLALAQYNRVDIALDPFPFSGSLTTCDALWMGVPVITCPGRTFASRHSLGHLSRVGLADLVARDRAHYVELAVALAGDRPRLAELRSTLRQRVAGSTLCDGPRLATDLLALLRSVWCEWVADVRSPLPPGEG
jgi:predicted O-linked N-acetylglucosamine transferase (SPINDLY family)